MGFHLGHTMRAATNNANGNRMQEDHTFSVNVFLSKNKIIRLIPGVKNRFGIYVPIPEGLEVSFYANPREIGKAYLKAASNALNHAGEDLDMRAAAPKYTSFQGFKSQNKFNSMHFCFSSFCIDGKITFTFLPWHKNEFCLLKSDIACILEIDDIQNEFAVGNAILEIIQKANEAYPELEIL